ncbi:hypothetical protein PO909_032045, partial [Leuciscus waleckii]
SILKVYKHNVTIKSKNIKSVTFTIPASFTHEISLAINIDRSRADTWEISSLCLLQCGNFGLASPEAFKGRESTAEEMDIPMIKLLQPVDLTDNLRLFPCSRSERSFVPP